MTDSPEPIVEKPKKHVKIKTPSQIKNDEELSKMKSWWRPMMAWVYMIIIMFDFVVAPIIWGILQLFDKSQTLAQWAPLTLQSNGLFHLAMGAVLGITSWGRYKEKVAKTEK